MLQAAVLAATPLLLSSAPEPIVELDHVLISVSPGAPERSALERAGFIVWPEVQRHDGQGTSSIMAELDRCFIELVWRDSSVAVAPDKEVVARKYALRSNWRSSGWSPFAIALRRTASAPDSLPFATWPVTVPWRPAIDVTQMITARSDSTSPSVWVVSRSTATDNSAAPAAARAHPNGARRITGLHLTIPRNTPESEALAVLRTYGVAELVRGDSWLLTVTLDSMAQKRARDLRPTLPLIVRF
jgi:hypothetical protein